MDVLSLPTFRTTGIARLRRLEADFLRPHRCILLLALGGMLVQSLLLLPIPLLQGMVLDRLVSATAETSGVLVLIATAPLTAPAVASAAA